MPELHSSSLPPVLDADQLRRIESVHRGYLYQHLYVVGCLLLAPRADVRHIIVEHDEDVELAFDGGRTYVQVKTRSAPLQVHDVQGALARFAVLRTAHGASTDTAVAPLTLSAGAGADGLGEAAQSAPSTPPAPPERTGTAQFLIVANVPPSPGLSAAMAAATWPTDVVVRWPDAPGEPAPGLAPAWPSVAAAFAWCTDLASAVPYSRVDPETLVWKLAALAQATAMGGLEGAADSHVFHVDRLSNLFEQVVQSLHAFPAAPRPHWPYEHEPTGALDTPVRLIIGPTGAGKTAWAAAAAVHAPELTAYFAIDVTGTSFAAMLVRDLAARFVADTPGSLATILMPGASGLDALRALDLVLQTQAVAPVVVLDDVHRVAFDELVRVVTAAPTIRWLLLAQPSPVVAQIEACFAIRGEWLAGWSRETIGAALRHAGCAADVVTCDRVRTLSAGLPLFVRNMAQLAQAQHDGDVRVLCDRLEQGTHLEQTAQEALLAGALAALSTSSRHLADVLGLAGLPLTEDEIVRLGARLELAPGAVGRGMRELAVWGITRPAPNGRVQLHDAFRMLCDGTTIGSEQRGAVLRELCVILDPETGGFAPDRAARFLAVLPLVGETERLIDIASNETEQLHELGLSRQVLQVLSATADDPHATPSARFWSHDTLAFFSLSGNRIDDAARHLAAMQELGSVPEIGARADAALGVKRIVLAGHRQNAGAARREYATLIAAYPDDAGIQRVAQYNLAVALFMAGQPELAANEAYTLVQAYYDVVGLDPARVYRANAPEVIAMLPRDRDVLPDLKRLADSLDLLARAQSARGRLSGLARLHAFKFYTICGAFQSAIKTGQDAVDEMLRMGDPAGARQFLEQTLLPSVEELRLFAYLVPVRAHYAVVLAYCGAFEAARAEMHRLEAFAASTPAQHDELRGQTALIEQIAQGHVTLRSPRPQQVALPRERQLPSTASEPRPGRNAPCPCGSGRKFKRCCGA